MRMHEGVNVVSMARMINEEVVEGEDAADSEDAYDSGSEGADEKSADKETTTENSSDVE
jgi:hypothetical protein